MEEIAKDGKAKNIGHVSLAVYINSVRVSNFNAQAIMDIHRYATVKPAVLQIEYHPYLQQPVLIEFCHKNGVIAVEELANSAGIAITGFSSFGGLSYQVFNPSAESLLDSEVIKAISTKHKVSASQV